MAADYHNDAGLQALFPVPIFLPGPVMARSGRTSLTAAAGQWKVKRKTSGPGRSDREIPKKPGTDRKAGRSRSLGRCTRHSGSWRIVLTVKTAVLEVRSKFPAPHNLIFLMEYGAREKRPEALAMAEKPWCRCTGAVSLTTLEADFPDIPRTGSGWCHTLRKCSTTTACLSWKHQKAYGSTGRKMYGCGGKDSGICQAGSLTDSQGRLLLRARGRGQRWCGRKILCIYPGGDKGRYWERKRAGTLPAIYGITGHGNFEGRSIPNLLEK